jgi:hypothetical protein
LTEGGQFYLDSSAGKVYYKPLSGQNMATADAHLGVLETLISVGGSYDAPAHDITFQGLSFVSTFIFIHILETYYPTGSLHMAQAIHSRLRRPTNRRLHVRENNVHILELRIRTPILVPDAIGRADQRS